MTSPADERVALRRAIEEAFADVPLPVDADLFGSRTPEAEALREAFRGKRWLDYRDRPLELLRAPYAAFAFFTPQAFHHYLPLGMLAAVDRYREADVLPQSLIFHLAPRDHDDGWREARVALLTPEQIRATAAFLTFVSRAHADDLAELNLGQIDRALEDLQARLARGTTRS